MNYRKQISHPVEIVEFEIEEGHPIADEFEGSSEDL